jgi:hypothetical protein
VTDSINTTSPARPLATKIRMLAAGTLTAAALSLPAISTTVAAHDAAKTPGKPAPVAPSSHRLALTLHSNSLRLT